ncbi:iron-containing redox enzyme family protein [Enterovibrio sp. ZSDZ42]|uniref:Iron-containing redox enzyme family protein n=1 Tax=Enterovibrio gelatinilyticus TaxID=2899819 RepID=A0ABT5QUN5_9GAMM|nr:iron-containing redox enzyme family protein [Enterovibrio sp. ZSDZ42]MDD1791724.1 iron-containing redox enzyme family protein [Enterovibrio sp. ZSDZ42]
MNMSNSLFDTPIFRKGVSITKSEDTVHINYRDQGCEISTSDFVELPNVLADLSEGVIAERELPAKYPALSSHIPDLIRELDRLSLLTEAVPTLPDKVMSGMEFVKDLQRMVTALMNKKGNSVLYDRMVSEQVTKQELVGYALEYFHIVRNAPMALGPALSKQCPNSTRRALMELFIDEHDHDKLLYSTAASIGITKNQLDATAPLPATFALYSTLETLARQHFLSFCSCLFLFEEPYPSFNSAFVDSCHRLGLPETFFEPIARHADINESGEHQNITEELLKPYTAISHHEQNVIKINIHALVETMYWQDRQISEYYSNAENTLRIFS